jgi:hypothetical protein
LTICLLLIAHIIGDFFLQTDRMAEKKKHLIRYLFIHGAVYTIPFLVLFLIENVLPIVIWGVIGIFITHVVLDFLKTRVFEKNEKSLWKPFLIFVTDQFMHIAVLIVFFFIFGMYLNIDILNWSKSLGNVTSLQTAIFILGILFLTKPSAIINRMVLNVFDFKKESTGLEQNDIKILRAGYVIGVLERLVLYVLFIWNQFAVMGFVLAAKSIARYKQMDQEGFAERYLIGTLLSTLEAIIVAFVLMNIKS